MYTAEISFSVAKEYRGKGLGTKALLLTSKSACSELAVSRLKGISFASNKASIGAFTKAGFKLLGREEIEGKACNVFMKDCTHTARKKTDR
jgi:RimJ/RimL family protein N-acetyltransferase